MRLPLRDGDVGRFLGQYYDGQRDQAEVEETKWVPERALFRNATVGVTFRWNGISWEPDELVGDPNGCRHCDHPKRDHCQSWVPVVGIHGFVEPTDEQRLERMQRRRVLSPKRTVRRLPA